MHVTSMVITDTSIQIVIDDIIETEYKLILTLVDENGLVEIKELINECIYTFQNLQPQTTYYCTAKFNDAYLDLTGFITYPVGYVRKTVDRIVIESKNPNIGKGVLGPTPPIPQQEGV